VSELRRQSLLDSLGLSQTQLQQLAGILGNDHIKHIAKDKITALKAAHPNEHPVAVLAKQVIELQPQLASLSPAAAAAAAATAAAKEAAAARERERALIDPVVRRVVEAAVASVVSKAAEAAAAAAVAAKASKRGKKAAAAGGAAAEVIAPEVKQLVATAVSRAVAAADGDAAGSDDEDEHHDELEDGHHEDDEQGHEDDAAAAGDAAGAAASGGSGAAAANPTDMLVDRCKRSLLQYGPCDVAPPVQVGSGDRWLLQHKGILMRGVGLEDMSKTPSHVLLQPLRLSVYASMGLSSVTEYLCLPDEKWKEWAAGRTVSVPAQPAAGGKKSGKPRRSKDKGAIDPAVKKLVAAMFANVLAANGGAPADAAEAAAPAAAESAAAEPAAAAAPAAAEATSAEESPADEPAAAAADEADVDGIHPAVKKLVAAAVANVVAGKVAGSRGGSKAYEPLPKALPSKPLELVQFIVRRLRALDPSAEQFSRKQEKLLLLQVG
jgi:hypothetical protein